jgi:hypothetical protein
MSIMSSTGKTVYELGFQISPIILTEGLAKKLPGQMLPIVTILQAGSLVTGLLSGEINLGTNKYFCSFAPLPGTTLIQNQVGMYPFANIDIAANAIIKQPLNVSLIMNCPVNKEAGYISKFMTISALKGALEYHISLGGSFIVATPSYIYTDCLLIALEDCSNGESLQAQNAWRWDFLKPLVSMSDALNAQSSLMGKLSGKNMVKGPSWSGLGTAIAPTLFPQITNLVGGLS